MKKTKQLVIVPKIRKDKNGNPKEVFIEYDVYKRIIKEIENMEKKIKKIKNKKS